MILAALSTLRDIAAAAVAEGVEHPSLVHFAILHIDFSDINSAKIL